MRGEARSARPCPSSTSSSGAAMRGSDMKADRVRSRISSCWVRIPSRLLLAVFLIATGLSLAPEHASAHVPHDEITHFAASPAFATDRIAFVISRNRVMRSTDGASTFKEIVKGIDRPLPTRFAIAPSDKTTMYLAVGGGGVYKSHDQGLSWQPTSTPAAMLNIAELAVSPTSADRVYAAGSTTGLFRTVDGGTSWSAVGTFGKVTTVLYPDQSGRVLVSDSTGAVFVSDNDGTTWVQSSGTISGDMVTAVAATPSGATPAAVFVGTKSGKLLRSTNRGTSFSRVGTKLPAEQVMSIAASNAYSTDKMVWVSTWTSGVYRSSDRGGTFTRQSAGLTTDIQATDSGQPQFRSLTVAPTSGGQALFLSGFDGLFRSDNNATQWREIQTLVNYVVGVAVSPDYADDGTVAATTYVKGAYLSTDRGATWRGAHVGLGSSPGTEFASKMPRLHNVQFSPNYENDGTIFTATWWDMLKSTDRGVSWTTIPVGTGPRDLRQFVIAVSPQYATDGTVYVGTRQGEIYRSTAQGAAEHVDAHGERRFANPFARAQPGLLHRAGALRQHVRSHLQERGCGQLLATDRSPRDLHAGHLAELPDRRQPVRRDAQRRVRHSRQRCELDGARRTATVDDNLRRGHRCVARLRHQSNRPRERVGQGLVPIDRRREHLQRSRNLAPRRQLPDRRLRQPHIGADPVLALLRTRSDHLCHGPAEHPQIDQPWRELAGAHPPACIQHHPATQDRRRADRGKSRRRCQRDDANRAGHVRPLASVCLGRHGAVADGSTRPSRDTPRRRPATSWRRRARSRTRRARHGSSSTSW